MERVREPLVLSPGPRGTTQKEKHRMPQSGTRLTLLAAAVTAFAALGCEGEISSGAGLADGLTADVGVAFRDEVEAAVGALTMGSALDPIGTTQAAGTATSLKAVPCVSPSAPADNDGDGVPDDAIYVFTAPPCRFTGWRGGTLDVVGQLRIQDPAPSSAGFGYEATVTGLALPLHQRRWQADLRCHPERHPEPERLDCGASADHRSPDHSNLCRASRRRH